MQTKTIANIPCRIKPGRSSGPTIILFHGYGANWDDLYPLANYVRVSSDITWIFPNGICKLDLLPGMDARAWFPLSLSGSIDTHDPQAMALAEPEGMEEARQQLTAFFDALEYDKEQLILGGFSQGSMLALDYVLHNDLTPLTLFLFSSTLVKKQEWQSLASQKQISFYQSHGTYDELLGFQVAESLYKMLIEAGWQGKFSPFEDGHTIPQKILQDMEEIINKLI